MTASTGRQFLRTGDLDRNVEHVRDGGVEVDARRVSLERHRQGVANGLVDPFPLLGVLPPASDGIDGEFSSAGQLGTGGLPLVLMERAVVALVRADKPGDLPSRWAAAALFGAGVLVHALDKLCFVLQRILEFEPESVGGVAVTLTPATT